MPSRLSRYCEGVIEAGWLTAVILVPLFYNVFSSRIFEPDKIALLRSIALLVVAAWLVKVIAEGGVRWENLKPGQNLFATLVRIPMVAPALTSALIFILATVLSVTPRVSLLGSYQRLQGTYTWLSYLVIFAALLGSLRRKEQVERLITTIVLVSIPIALYGIMQRYQIDPIPWGGNTVRRIASNMGNSIFIAAYLIMVFPLTLGRIVQSFGAILREDGKLFSEVTRATVYVFSAAVQIIAIYMSGSRGPVLGLMAGAFFMLVLLSLVWGRRRLMIGFLGMAVALGAFLLVFNIPNGPLESLRRSPAIGRFGLLLDSESNSALVRKYIWQGASELVSPHEPLTFPDGKQDGFNALRPLIGYGPESMYVAYNPFYVPELAQVEKRNASPDRSHNETWDTLVITGVLGILVYLSLFTLVFYYAMSWIGLVPARRQQILYFSLVLGGGLVGGVGFAIWRGVAYFGVGTPFGMLLGMLAYLTFVALFVPYRPPATREAVYHSVIMTMLVAALVAHFVEINFGIAIAVTRTYFWVYTGLLVCLGYIFPRLTNAGQTAGTLSSVTNKAKSGVRGGRKKRKGATQRGRGSKSNLVGGLMAPGLLTGIVMATLGYNFISNPGGNPSGMGVLWAAFTRLPNKQNAISYGVLGLILFTWLLLALVYTAEWARRQKERAFARGFVIILLTGLGAGLLFWLWQSASLAAMARMSANTLADVMAQVARYENLLGRFYVVSLALVLWLGIYLSPPAIGRQSKPGTLAVASSIVGLVLVLVLSAYTNLRVIQADIVFKLAEPFTRSAQWPVAITIYERANELAPNEDYYYLFLGRAYLEHAKTLSSVSERDQLIRKAEKDLKKAQEINPLNTDHTANLARLYSLWASVAQDADQRANRGEISGDYFDAALQLSPKNARIWDESAMLYLNVLQQPEEALKRLEHSLDIDARYHWTYALMGEYYSRLAAASDDATERNKFLAKAAENYATAKDLPTPGEPRAHYNYALALGGAYAQMQDYSQAVAVYLQAIELAPRGVETWRVEEAIGGLYVQMGDPASALIHIQKAYELAPEDQRERLGQFVVQLGGKLP